MPGEMRYGKAVLIGLDQLVNALLGGWPDETLSSRAFRWGMDGVRKWPCLVIDALFFWDRERRGEFTFRHCALSYKSERERLQQPPELR